ncbi:hypothetical protein [Tautonia marina]|uniref:hypothetical protein n=1 Tax=Tautonia marina TaxID=2653855 RepID=UPI001260C5A5|nr:hypothetical protein [Tautonia marina]
MTSMSPLAQPKPLAETQARSEPTVADSRAEAQAMADAFMDMTKALAEVGTVSMPTVTEPKT